MAVYIDGDSVFGVPYFIDETGGVSSTSEDIILIDGDIITYRSSTAAEKRLYSVATYDGVAHTETYKRDMDYFCDQWDIDKKDITFTYETEDVSHALHNVKTIMNTIISSLPHKEVKVFLTGDTNFRNEVYPDYKMHRAEMHKPTHLEACRQYLIKNYGAVVSDGCEADDLLSIEAYKDLERSIIVSIDKDLDMVPCKHWNFTKNDGVYTTNKMEGLGIFYRQLLTGDRVDNIPGLKGVGPKNAKKIIPLDTEMTEYEMYRAVLLAYMQRGIIRIGKTDEQMEDPVYITSKIREVSRNARLLFLQTKVGEVWQPPYKKEDMDGNQEAPLEV